MQCKDIPDKPILEFLNGDADAFEGWRVKGWGCIFEGDPESIINAMPENTPRKLQLAKMAQLIKRGLIDGCTCGCRGDFEITDKGRDYIN